MTRRSGGREGSSAVRRSKAAHSHRARAHQRAEDPSARRSHQRSRLRVRAHSPRSSRRRRHRPHHRRHRPSPLHHTKRTLHRLRPFRPSRRNRISRGARRPPHRSLLCSHPRSTLPAGGRGSRTYDQVINARAQVFFFNIVSV